MGYAPALFWNQDWLDCMDIPPQRPREEFVFFLCYSSVVSDCKGFGKGLARTQKHISKPNCRQSVRTGDLDPDPVTGEGDFPLLFLLVHFLYFLELVGCHMMDVCVGGRMV